MTVVQYTAASQNNGQSASASLLIAEMSVAAAVGLERAP